jgi:hypothetical protein
LNARFYSITKLLEKNPAIIAFEEVDGNRTRREVYGC